MKSFVRATAFALIAVVGLSQAASASEAQALALFDEAKVLFADRTDMAKLNLAISKLEAALPLAETTETKYDILILNSRSLYFKGIKTSGNEAKMAIHGAALDKSKAASALDDQYAEAYYQYAINLGRWAEAKGILASLSRKDELIGAAEKAIERITRLGAAGEEIDGYGPARTLGRVYFKLPGFAGGSRSKSLEYLNQAYENAPENSLNTVYLAEVLSAGNSAEKNRARQILKALLENNDPATLNPDRIPETQDEFNQARALLRDLG